jgi:hypothetical protein
MKKLGLSKIKTAGILGLLATASIFFYFTKSVREKDKEEETTKYNATKQKDYNKDFDSIYPVVDTLPTRYLDRDSSYLRVHYIEGCRWVGVINGGCSDKDYHTISNCPKCTNFFVSLLSEH